MKNFTLGLVVLLIIFGGFFLYSKKNPAENVYKNDNTVPATSQSTASGSAQSQEIQLSVNSPTLGQTVTTPTIMVSGNTASNAEVSINDKDIAADSLGNFSMPVVLDEGENIINISASDKEGNYTEKELTVILNTEQ